MITIEILYFAVTRDLTGVDRETRPLPAGVEDIDALSAHLETVHPALAGRLASVRFARNEEFAKGTDRLANGDVIALIPPVAGGLP